MRRALRCVMGVGILLVGLVATDVAAAAQDRPTEMMEIVREKARADKKLLVAQALELTDAEARDFWPLYNSYQSDMIDHYDRLLELVRTYAGTWETMSDDAATSLLTQYLALEGDYAALLKSYAPRFQQVLPARKVVRLYQIENKLRTMVLYDLARQIPLIK